MANPPFENTRLAEHEKLDQKKQIELFDSITRNFEDLYNKFQTQQSATESANAFLKLAAAGRNKISFGVSSLTFTASNQSASKEVLHKLGVTPQAVVCTALTSPAFGKIPIFNITSGSKTAFILNGETKEALTGPVSFYWIAIG